jgi:hypothetical protein
MFKDPDMENYSPQPIHELLVPSAGFLQREFLLMCLNFSKASLQIHFLGPDKLSSMPELPAEIDREIEYNAKVTAG